MNRKRNNTALLILVCLVAIIIIVDVCRHRKQSSPTAQTNSRISAPTDNNNMLLGNPTNATHDVNNADNYLIDHTYYIESYSRSRGIPNWVCWHVNASDLGRIQRVDDFRADNSLPPGWYAVSPSNYKSSGFDKGHNCPSGDRTATQEANSSTFLMDNIIPQAPRNNEQTWEHLESYCRSKVTSGNEVYVIMGNYGIGGTGSKGFRKTIGGGKVTVPAHVWKVVIIIPDGNNDLARINEKTTLIAVDMPNDNSISNNWMDYLTTVSNIEKATGEDLLSSLPKSLQNVLELKKFAGGN